MHSDAPLRQQAGASAVTDGAGAGLLSTVPVADGAGPADTHAASTSGEDPEEQFFSLEYVLTGPYCAFFRESPPLARATNALTANQLAVLRRSHGMCTPLSPTHWVVHLLAVLRRSHNLFTRSRLFIANP